MGEEQQEEIAGLTEGYTAGQAAEVMMRNSGKVVTPMDVRKLAEKGVIGSILINPRLRLYNKEQVDKYVVEDRGVKAGRAARARARAKSSEGEAA
jgi:hypothetical protein